MNGPFLSAAAAAAAAALVGAASHLRCVIFYIYRSNSRLFSVIPERKRERESETLTLSPCFIALGWWLKSKGIRIKSSWSG